MHPTIAELCELAISSPDNERVKKKYRAEATKYLKRLADALELPPSTYNLHYNAGGTAVAGDITLHHDKLYVTFGDCLGGMIGLARSCEGRKDYTGGQNHPIESWTTNAHLLEICRRILARG